MSGAGGSTEADRVARERLAREARETATTLLDWVGTRVEGADGGAERPRQSPGPCTWCPVCALAAALRGEQPELTATLAEQASGLLVLLRLLVQAHATGTHEHHAPAPDPTFPDPTPGAAPAGWPSEWGTPTWTTDVPWETAPHAVFDPEPVPARDDPADAADVDPRPADRPTGKRGPRPSPRHSLGDPTPADPRPADPTPAAAAPSPGGPTTTAPAPERARRGVQRIPVRRRPRPC
ncbi:hypothetical protein [Actinomycetospora termitidis]|uniref:Uncharacterized protein n=1 Tax=Actinomycetospora termitidis TaxID=3053470 RepID=A0ABT7MBR0_9PSEU|nr:hypothetical protein [Actinomycetospora sp. Odt1-22]MDL5156853.1 hypothetical protein [Actinomycetospora sp. Odt1-22]